MIKCGIYKIQNKITHKVYIGQSTHIYRRWHRHHQDAQKLENESSLYLAIRKYGIQNFDFSIIEECPKEELNQKQIYYISLYNSLAPNGYNLTSGGDAPTIYVGGVPYDTIKKIKEELLTNTTDNSAVIGEKFGVSQRLVRGINSGEYWYEDEYNYPLRPTLMELTKQEPNKCIDCGTALQNARITRCIECYNAYRRHNWPTREELKTMVRVLPFTKIGEKLGCSDRMVSKMCVCYNLPSKKKDIKSFSNQEWAKL